MKMGNVEKFNEANINDDLKKCERPFQVLCKLQKLI